MLKFPLRSSPSLRRVLLVPYILLILTMALIIGVSSYRAGDAAVEQVSSKLLEETVQRLSQATLHHLAGSAAVLEAAFPNDMPAPVNLQQSQRELISRFWIATSLHLDPNNYVYYGNNLGQGFGLYRHSRDEAELRIKYQAERHRDLYRLNGLYGPLKHIGREERLFDPRTRPWYVAGEQASQHTWTAVYIDFGARELIATRARSVHARTGEVAGVVATDVSLRALNTFISELKPSANGLALLIEPDGSLIASSNGSNLLIERHIGVQRRHVKDDRSPLVQAVYGQLQQHLRDDGLGESPQTFSFRADNGEQISAAFGWVRDDAGLAWIALVAMPRSDFLAGITESAKLTALIAGCTVLIALLLGLGLLHWVVDDLGRLADAARRVGRGQSNVRLNIDRRDEVGRLAHAFTTMYRELSTDRLTGVASRTALMRQLEYSISQAKGQQDGFALLFIDLNRFKAINDTYGHDAGDLALQEAAQRLRAAVRQDDLVARLGGDEFVIVLWRTTSAESIHQACDKLISELSQPLTRLAHIVGDNEVSVGAAIGVAIYPQDGEDADSLLKQADQNMYRAKHER